MSYPQNPATAFAIHPPLSLPAEAPPLFLVVDLFCGFGASRSAWPHRSCRRWRLLRLRNLFSKTQPFTPMLLGFKQQFPWGEPTDFKGKILAGLQPRNLLYDQFTPKIHTIRHDPTDRWKPGMSIQFAHGVRTPNLEIWYDSRGQERGHCVSVQKLAIGKRGVVLLAINEWEDSKKLNESETLEMARNDGFADIEQMLRWFFWKAQRQFIYGKLIHWTDKRY